MIPTRKRDEDPERQSSPHQIMWWMDTQRCSTRPISYHSEGGQIKKGVSISLSWVIGPLWLEHDHVYLCPPKYLNTTRSLNNEWTERSTNTFGEDLLIMEDASLIQVVLTIHEMDHWMARNWETHHLVMVKGFLVGNYNHLSVYDTVWSWPGKMERMIVENKSINLIFGLKCWKWKIGFCGIDMVRFIVGLQKGVKSKHFLYYWMGATHSWRTFRSHTYCSDVRGVLNHIVI